MLQTRLDCVLEQRAEELYAVLVAQLCETSLK
jgi:hypothetical protein